MVQFLKMPTHAQLRRQMLLHLKCLIWCLHQMQTRYDLNLVLYSIERRAVHPEIRDSNLGDNLSFLLEHLEPADLDRLSAALHRLPLTTGSLDTGDLHFEIGHYIQAVRDFGPIRRGDYGVIARISPQLRGLFYLDGAHLIEAPFESADVRTIFGTYII
jgi:hypothetical protein